MFIKKWIKSFHKHFFAAWINSISSILLVSVILFIATKFLSTSELNAWFLISSMIALSQSVQSGAGYIIERYINYSNTGIPLYKFRSIAKNNITLTERKICTLNQTQNIINFSLLLYIFFAILFVSICLIVGELIVEPLITPNLPRDVYKYSWIVLIILSSVSMFLSFSISVMRGLKSVLATEIIQALCSFVVMTQLLGYAFFSSQVSLTQVLFAQPLALLAANILIAYKLKKKLNKIGIISIYPKFSKFLFNLFFDALKKTVVTIITSSIIKNLPTPIFTLWLSPSSLSSILTTIRIFDLIEKILASTYNVTRPILINLKVSNKLSDYKKTLSITFQILMLILLLFFIIISNFGQNLFDFIGINILIPSYSILFLLSLKILISRWAGILLDVSNHVNVIIEHKTSLILTFGLMSLIICMHYLNVFSVINYLICYIFSLVMSSIFIIKNVYSYLNESFLTFEQNFILPSLIIFTLVFIMSI